MSSILYYSNFCQNSKNILLLLTKSNLKNDIHFICIDKRIQKNNNNYAVLENNDTILIPNTVNSVPCLLLINQNYKTLFGTEIIDYLKPINNEIQQKATNFNGEPSAFSINSGFSGVVSDNFSFLDQNSDELAAKGNGGMRQLYNYATINHSDKIETPPDEYMPDKIGDVSLENLQNERNKI